MRWMMLAAVLAGCAEGKGEPGDTAAASLAQACPLGDGYELAAGGVLCGDEPHPAGYDAAEGRVREMGGCARVLYLQPETHRAEEIWRLEYDEPSPGGRVIGTLLEAEQPAEFTARWYLEASGSFHRLELRGATFDALTPLGIQSCPGDGMPGLVFVRALEHD